MEASATDRASEAPRWTTTRGGASSEAWGSVTQPAPASPGPDKGAVRGRPSRSDDGAPSAEAAEAADLASAAPGGSGLEGQEEGLFSLEEAIERGLLPEDFEIEEAQ